MKDLRRYRSLLAVCGLLGCILAISAGCPKPPPPAPPKNAAQTAPLRVMVVDDPPLAAAVAREWLAHTESKVELVEITAEKAAAAGQLPVDVVIYPPALLGQFATADLLLPLQENALSDPTYARDEILPLLKTVETTWGRRTVAVPLGSPQLILWYRVDLLAEQNLQPPKTWQEYAAAVEKFADKPQPEVENWQPTAEPLAAGWAGKLLLARAAASALHRDQLSPLWTLEKMEPLIDGPPWVRALEQLVAANRHKNEEERKLFTPIECFGKFQAGECAFAIGWPGATEKAAASPLKPEQIGVTQLPGSTEVFQPTTAQWEPVAAEESIHVPLLSSSGRVASVTRASAQPQVATQFVLWLSGPAVSGRVAAVSSATTVFRTSHFRSGGSWQAPATIQAKLPAYGELLFAQPEAGRRFSLPRIPGEHEYLAALDAAVLSACKGDQPAAAALQSAAAEWREITKRRGLSSQQRALRRSLGLSD
jgi:multiple sugar transport system substrate-binding protein